MLNNFFFYFLYLLFNRKIIKALIFYYKIFFRALNYRYFKIKYFYYPYDIKKLSLEIEKKIRPRRIVEEENSRSKVFIPNGPKKLKLANGYLEFDAYPNWNIKFKDDEQTLSLHRWNWILRSITDEKVTPSYEWGIQMVRSYLQSQSSVPYGIASESYTTGERISNICLFNWYYKKDFHSLPEDILGAIELMSNHLLKNIEYYGDHVSGNHIINNARAFICASHSIKNENYLKLGRSLLSNMLPKLVDNDGFLREGSSHYQFLFTRWILEIRLISEECKDSETLKIIHAYLPKLVNGCKFFIIESSPKNKIATFGDISPDCDPDWLINLPKSSLATFSENTDYKIDSSGSWNFIFENWNRKNFLQWDESSACQKIKNSDTWSRIDFKDWVLILHHESINDSPIASHAHYDFCSFVLYYKTQELIIDPGRVDYQNTRESLNYIYPNRHSTVTLNKQPGVMLRNNKSYYSKYLKVKYFVTHDKTEQQYNFSIKHNGFSRTNFGNIYHERSILLYEKEIFITDKFTGRGNYTLNNYLQIPIELDTKKNYLENINTFIFILEKIKVSIKQHYSEKRMINNDFLDKGSYKVLIITDKDNLEKEFQIK